VAEADVADGYHRLSLAYALDPYAEVPLKLGGPGATAQLSGHRPARRMKVPPAEAAGIPRRARLAGCFMSAGLRDGRPGAGTVTGIQVLTGPAG